MRLHKIIVFSRDTQCRCHLTMEQGGRTKHFLLAGCKMVDLKSLSILPEAHPLRRTDKILLGLILTVQFDQDFLQISACFHSNFPLYLCGAYLYARLCVRVFPTKTPYFYNYKCL